MSVDVQLSHYWRDAKGKLHNPGDRVSVDQSTANQLVQGGRAKPATKADAKEARVDPESAASVKK